MIKQEGSGRLSTPKVEPSIECICPYGDKLQKYWDKLSQKERRMSLDPEALYSLAIQEVALNVAMKIPEDTVVDAFCGAGGFAIAFARTGKMVTAIEIDENRLAMARKNAELFGVADRIEFCLGRAELMLNTIKGAEVIFLDPPWGGPSYSNMSGFLLSNFQPDGTQLLKQAFSITDRVVMRLPKNFNFSELDQFNKPLICEDKFNNKLEHYTAYWEN